MITTKYEIDIGLCIRKHVYIDDNPYHTDNNIQTLVINLPLSSGKKFGWCYQCDKDYDQWVYDF